MDSNPVYRFFTHPFMRSLGKLSAYIIVGWNALMFAMFGPLLGFIMVFGLALGSTPAASSHLDNLEHISGDGTSSQQLLAITIQGEIVGETEDPTAAFGNVTNGYDVKRKLQEAAGRSEIRGVILEINSPGGTIYGSRAIADGIKYYREQTKQPVWAHIQGVGASGAYWAAAAADRIVADYGSDVGSIGVLMGPFKYYDTVMAENGGVFSGGVITQNGIQSTMITAGRSKDVGSPYRRLTAEEQRQLQQSINNEYDNFVSFVGERRHLSDATIRTQIGAMIYDNKTAQTLKLIDETASRDDTYTKLAEAAKLGKDYQVMRQATPAGLLQSLLGVVHLAPAPSAKATFDTCTLSGAKLAYYGDATRLCQ